MRGHGQVGRRRRRGPLIACLAVGGALLAPAGAGAARLDVDTLAPHPERVSGGDAVVRVTLPRRADLGSLRVRLNGADVTPLLRRQRGERALAGLVEGFRAGRNVLGARVERRRAVLRARSVVENVPSSGPLFAGPQQQPWICETEASGLGPPQDASCTVSPRTDWFYRAADDTFKPLADPASRPADLVQTTTLDGRTVDYVVRVDSGVVARQIYRIAVLDDPRAPIDRPWSPGGRGPGPGWNGKLAYRFLGGWGAGYRSGSSSPGTVLDHTPLSLGFAVATGTKNFMSQGGNDVVSAEAATMIKELVVERVGLPRFTIGYGTSAGAMQQHLVAQNYPGLLDALITGISYPDLFTTWSDNNDCAVLYHYFDRIADPANWPTAKRAAVTGFNATPTGETCRSFAGGFGGNLMLPTANFSSVVPLDLRYDPVTNPGGARGSIFDQYVNQLGRDPATGFARIAWDNEGVQYGLAALNAGAITKEEFIDLNARAGGRDFDGRFVADRTRARPEAIARAYRSGRVTTGENLALPIIDDRDYRDDRVDIHTSERTFSLLERLRAHGLGENRVHWRHRGSVPGVDFARMALLAHDEWLEALAADRSRAPYHRKVVRAKPDWLVDTCWDADGTAYREPIGSTRPGICNTLMPPYANPRIAAGAPVANDVLKCRLKPVDRSDYAVAFTREELARLRAAFPTGVCDWSRRGIEQQPIAGTWQDFGSGR